MFETRISTHISRYFVEIPVLLQKILEETMENLPANCRMRTIRAEALAMKDRAKVQRVDTLAKNALFLEYVRRWEPDHRRQGKVQTI